MGTVGWQLLLGVYTELFWNISSICLTVAGHPEGMAGGMAGGQRLPRPPLFSSRHDVFSFCLPTAGWEDAAQVCGR